MSFFNILADATEDHSKLGGKAIDVAHRTHNGILNAVGVSKILPSPVKSLADGVFDANKALVEGAGSTTAGMLRSIGGAFGATQQNSHQVPEHQHPNNRDGTRGYGDDSDDNDSHVDEDDESDGEDKDKDDEDNEDDEDDEDDEDEVGEGSLGEEWAPPPRHLRARPDRHDARDHHFKYDSKHRLSAYVDLRHLCPPVYDQGQMGSCTSHAVAAAFEFSVMQQNLPHFSPSRLFIWYKSRELEQRAGIHDAVKKNIGVSLRNAIKSVSPKNKGGVCSEEDWSYEVCKYNKKTLYFVTGAKARRLPSAAATKHSYDHTAVQYAKFDPKGPISLSKQLMQCLDKGIPFVFGMSHCDVIKGTQVSETGHGVPKKLTAKQLKDKKPHNHSLMAVGYIKSEKQFIIRNSWGAHWGEGGYFYMPFSLLKYCYDFWSIKVNRPHHK
ncbi:hypothetical protein RhiTH_004099 [Rhizoctonia solani]